MSWKTRSQCFKGHFNEVDVWSLIIAKRVVWCPIIAIFSGRGERRGSEGAGGGTVPLAGERKREATERGLQAEAATRWGFFFCFTGPCR
jgi:hypothetical protein